MTPDEREKIEALVGDPHFFYDHAAIQRFVEYCKAEPITLPPIYHDEFSRWQKTGKLDPPDRCLCRRCKTKRWLKRIIRPTGWTKG